MSTEPKRFRLVIIDDNRSDIVLLREAIEDSAHAIEVITFADPLQALVVLVNEPRADLILSDVNMPVMNGFELATQIRTIPRMRDVGIVLMSSGTDLDMPAAMRRECGDVTYIRKGSTWGDYRAIVDALYRRMSAQRIRLDLGLEDPEASKPGSTRG